MLKYSVIFILLSFFTASAYAEGLKNYDIRHPLLQNVDWQEFDWGEVEVYEQTNVDENSIIWIKERYTEKRIAMSLELVDTEDIRWREQSVTETLQQTGLMFHFTVNGPITKEVFQEITGYVSDFF